MGDNQGNLGTEVSSKVQHQTPAGKWKQVHEDSTVTYEKYETNKFQSIVY